MAVGGVDHHHVDPRLHQGQGALEAGVADRGGRPDQQTALGVLGRMGVGLGLLHVLDGDQADGAVVLVHHDQALDLVAAQQRPRLGLADPLTHGDQVLVGHQLGSRDLVGALEPHVAVGQDAHQLAAAALHHREAGDVATRLDLLDFLKLRIRVDGHRIDDHAALVALDLAHLVGLLLHRQIAVQDAQTSGLGHGDGQPAFGDGVHSRGHQGDVQCDLPSELCGGADLCRHHLRRTRL